MERGGLRGGRYVVNSVIHAFRVILSEATDPQLEKLEVRSSDLGKEKECG